MSKTNCINCGAAKDTEEIKCPFCGTTYIDLTCIDFSSRNPVACSFKLPTDDEQILTFIAIPTFESIEYEPIYCSFRDRLSIRAFVDSYNANVGISFRPLAQKDGSLFKVRKVANA